MQTPRRLPGWYVARLDAEMDAVGVPKDVELLKEIVLNLKQVAFVRGGLDQAYWPPAAAKIVEDERQLAASAPMLRVLRSGSWTLSPVESNMSHVRLWYYFHPTQPLAGTEKVEPMQACAARGLQRNNRLCAAQVMGSRLN
jgi:hypothetical protein